MRREERINTGITSFGEKPQKIIRYYNSETNVIDVYVKLYPILNVISTFTVGHIPRLFAPNPLIRF